ncbi:MAG: hypothetical protein RBU27_13110 [Bacteroidota bacterium]|nr:hypothetical protein [Bacteroidota bacterium]
MHSFRSCLLPLLVSMLFIPPVFADGSGPDDREGLYMPRDIRRAYERGTRGWNGAPGVSYWQNAADYRIRVTVHPDTRLLVGEETITYHNNSPDTLRRLVLKLHQNMNRAGAARCSPLGAKAVTDGVRLSALTVDGIDRNRFPGSEEATIDGGNLIVTLPRPLAPKSSIDITAAWDFIIPVTTGEGGGNPRMGAYENGAIFVAYWYPKVAVYDDVHGWDMHSYDGEHEFYNDYGAMDVEITVPDRYGVWATGSLDNPEDVLREPYLSRYRTALVSDTVVRIINEAEAAAAGGMKPGAVWRFRATSVPDFAFGIARGYCWDGVSADNGIGRVFVDAAYDPAATSFATVAAEAKETVEMMSRARPGVPFPYPAMKAWRTSFPSTCRINSQTTTI